MDNDQPNGLEALERVFAEMRALIDSQQKTIESQNETISAITSFLGYMASPEPVKQGKGRPSKSAPEMGWAAWIDDVRQQYTEAEAGREKAGVVTILTWFIERELAKSGKPNAFVRRDAYQKKLKTLAVRISNSRSTDLPAKMKRLGKAR